MHTAISRAAGSFLAYARYLIMTKVAPLPSLLLLVVLLVPLASPTRAEEASGSLEFLRPAPQFLRPAPRQSWIARVERARQTYGRFAARATESFALLRRMRLDDVPALRRLEFETRIGSFDDPTLRYGDVVVTDRGLFVYRGDGDGHAPLDFARIVEGRSRSVPHLRQLLQIDRVNRL
jgi:hypothetical protein